MKTNRPSLQAPEESPKVATATELVSNLLQVCEQFGISRNADFASRASVVAFTNAALLAKRSAEQASTLAGLVDPDRANREACKRVGKAIVAEVPDNASWLTNLGQSLRSHWAQSPFSGEADTLERQIIFALAAGLETGTSQVEFTDIIHKRALMLGDEGRYLASRLINWAETGFRPSGEFFIEYFSVMYGERPHERNVLCVEASQTLACAKFLPNPWLLSFWVEQGWERGRHFVRKHPAYLRLLLLEAPQKNREYNLRLYRSLVLDAATLYGQVDIERATLAYFSKCNEGKFAVDYCAGNEPRKLIRHAFDFSFWMGVLSAMPLPDHCMTAASPNPDATSAEQK